MVTRAPDDVARLEDRLRAALPYGIFDTTVRALYASDASNYRQLPLGVVLPRTEDELVATVASCHDLDVPIVLRGGGTSLGGQAAGGGVVIDTSRHLDRILELAYTHGNQSIHSHQHDHRIL